MLIPAAGPMFFAVFRRAFFAILQHTHIELFRYNLSSILSFIGVGQ